MREGVYGEGIASINYSSMVRSGSTVSSFIALYAISCSS